MLLLIISIITLLVGPVIYTLVRKRDIMLSLMDGFIFVAIAGLVLLYILPDCFGNGGWPTFLFTAMGLFGPTLLERISRRSARETHIVALGLGIIGLGLHAIIDGSTLAHGSHGLSESTHTYLPLAVILHRLPVGLTIWWLLRPSLGFKVAAGILSLVAVATVGGYSLGPLFLEQLSTQGISWFQAFVAGSLMHVVFHQPHLSGGKCGCIKTTASNNQWEGMGALIGIGLMFALISDSINHAETHILAEGIKVFTILALESAPALLIAYLMAGLMNAYLPRSSVTWMQKGRPWTQSLKGMAIGLPIPICSCGVVPLYRTLVKSGAPATAAMAFLISTPELGLDAIFLSIPLLGGEMAVIRVIAAALVAFLVGLFVGRTLKSNLNLYRESGIHVSSNPGLFKKLKKGMKTGFGDLVDHTAPWIILGLAIAALAEPFLDSTWLSRIPANVDVVIFALLGLPVYVCASGATPLVAVLLFNGISPGAALAFLLTGPATNVTTFGVLSQLHGRKTALAFSVSIISMSVVLGMLVNYLYPSFVPVSLEGLQQEASSPFRVLSLIVLSTVFLSSVFRRGPRQFVSEVFFQDTKVLDLHPHYHH
jgi:uncharacterized membrane protein YraQ (UPF0718 family)